MKISGFTLIRNGLRFDYPFRESIRSLLPLVDELVVVDTGSRDRTREMARAAGATVVEHPWGDDFAAARAVAAAWFGHPVGLTLHRLFFDQLGPGGVWIARADGSPAGFLLGMVSLKIGRSVAWDADRETIPGDAEAAKFLRREYRKGWEIQ